MSTPYTTHESNGKWIAHAVAFDIVSSGDTQGEAINRLSACLRAYIEFGKQQGYTLSRMYFAAPQVYWKAPFYEMDLPPAASDAGDNDAIGAARKEEE